MSISVLKLVDDANMVCNEACKNTLAKSSSCKEKTVINGKHCILLQNAQISNGSTTKNDVNKGNSTINSSNLNQVNIINKLRFRKVDTYRFSIYS